MSKTNHFNIKLETGKSSFMLVKMTILWKSIKNDSMRMFSFET